MGAGGLRSWWQRAIVSFAATERASLEAAYRRELAALSGARRGIAQILANERRLDSEAATLHDGTAARERLLAVTAALRARRVALEALADEVLARLERVRSAKLATRRRA